MRNASRRKAVWDADVAQLVERILGKNEVSGPIPGVGSSISSPTVPVRSPKDVGGFPALAPVKRLSDVNQRVF